MEHDDRRDVTEVGGGSKVQDSRTETGRRVAKNDQGQKNGRSAATGTAAARQEAIRQVADGYPPPPVALRAVDVEPWGAIMRARLPQAWADVDLVLAANLARTLADIETQRRRLTAEGDLVGKDVKRINPRHALIETLNRRAMAWTRVLQLHGVATIGPKGKGAAASKADAGAAAAALGVGSQAPAGADPMDDLLARPRRLQ